MNGASAASVRSAAPAALVSSLDNSQINSNTRNEIPRGRGKWCGQFTASSNDPNNPKLRSFRRMNCKCWDCAYCAPRRAMRYKNAIRREAERLQLRRFVTLTLDPNAIAKVLPGESEVELLRRRQRLAVPYLRECFRKFRIYLKRNFGEAPQYIAVLEFHKSGLPHLHLIIDRFIAQRWMSKTWKRIGGGFRVDIRLVDMHRVTHYLSKYLTKELLCSAPKRSRRITCSRGIVLNPKQTDCRKWSVQRIPIYALAPAMLESIIESKRDIEGFLSELLCHDDGPGNSSSREGVIAIQSSSL